MTHIIENSMDKSPIANDEGVVSSSLLYAFSSRGIGSEFGKCFKCNTTDFHNNISGFVKTKEDGEKIVEMFNTTGVYLDYRPSEPEWIQVKILACKQHALELKLLDLAIRYKKGISPEIVKFIH